MPRYKTLLTSILGELPGDTWFFGTVAVIVIVTVVVVAIYCTLKRGMQLGQKMSFGKHFFNWEARG